MSALSLQSSQAEVLKSLRQKIEALEAAPRQWLISLSTGQPQVDATGLFRLGCAVELSGDLAGGRTTMALSLVASACREKRLCAWVDGPHELYPPAAVPMGVELNRLLMVRPRAPGQLVWSAVQLLRSGTFTCVVLDITHTGVRIGLPEAKKLADAARAGGALLVVLTVPGQAEGLVRAEMTAARQGGLGLVVTQPEPPGDFTFEIKRSGKGAQGRRISLMRHGFSKVGPLRCRPAAAVGGARAPSGLMRPRVLAISSLQRIRRNVMRDGYGIDGARIGRDTPFRLAGGRR